MKIVRRSIRVEATVYVRETANLAKFLHEYIDRLLTDHKETLVEELSVSQTNQPLEGTDQ